ncbi:MAG: adenylate/guanylate cyclase domain-containing protein [Bacteroidia bacterium]
MNSIELQLREQLKTTENDILRIRLLNELAYEMRTFNADESILLAQQALELADRLDYTHESARTKANLSHFYMLNSDLESAKSFSDESLKVLQELNDKEGMAKIYLTIGNIHHRQGDFHTSLQNFQKSMVMYEELGELGGLASALKNLALVYYRFGDTKTAEEYLNRQLEISRQIGDLNSESNALTYLARNGLEQGQVSEAMEKICQSIEIKKQTDDQRGLALARNILGRVYLQSNRLKEAEEVLRESLEDAIRLKDKYGTIVNLTDLSKVQNELQQYDSALKLAARAEKLAVEINARESLIKIYYAKYVSYNATCDFKKALEMYSNYHKAESDVMSVETTGKIRSLEATYRSQLAEKEAEVYRLKNVELAAKNREIKEEKRKSEELLLNILPAEIAEELKEKGRTDARDFDMVSILFTDFKEFTQTSETLSAKELVEEINICFEAFDAICEKYGIEKIKTIGDSYMAAGGLPAPTGDSVKNTLLSGLEMSAFMIERKQIRETAGQVPFEMRTGIHTGPVVAGIVGIKKFQYDIWGDTVNTASRMETHGDVDKVNISQSTYELIKDDPSFRFESRGKIQAKGKGEVEMYFVELKIDQ